MFPCLLSSNMTRDQFKTFFLAGAQADPDVENPLDKMSEEEKEREAEKLAILLSKLNEKGIVKPVAIGPDGKPVEINTEDD